MNTFALMPLHSIELLPTGARLGLWQLRETAAELWPQLPQPAYRGLYPAAAPPARQAQWLAGRVLVHELLKQAQNPVFGPAGSALAADNWVANDALGRPHVLGWPAAAVSLSHSGVWVAALLAPGGRAGVDIELVRDKAQRLARRFLADAELDFAAAAGGGPALFSLLWSAKETLYKLAGQRGLIFRNDLLTTPFAYQTTGELSATIARPEGQSRHRVCYAEPAPDYVLTYCHEPADFPVLRFPLDF